MGFNLIDISSGVITLALAAVLLCLRMPHDKRWKALRRTIKLLAVCYLCMGISNLITGQMGVSEAENTQIGISIVMVSMFQALFFTATCLAFVSPGKVGIRWLSANLLAATAACLCFIFFLIRCEWATNVVWGAVIAVYAGQLVYYCRLFRKSYKKCIKTLEDNYDDELAGGLRWIRNCFLGALTVGVSALLFALFKCGGVMYAIFTSVYTVYYVYLVVCVINYRIDAGYIVKVVASEEAEAEDNNQAQEPPKEEPKDAAASDTSFDEESLKAAIEKWVEEKKFVKNDQTVEEIAHELGTTHAVLKWYFTNRMHTNFRTWRIALRIDEAQRLLKDGSVATATVHKMVGIADKSNFHKQFRQAIGMTPKEYAERMSVTE